MASLTHFHILVEFRQLVDVEPQLLERALITHYTDEVPDQSKTGSFPDRYREQGVSPPNGLLPNALIGNWPSLSGYDKSGVDGRLTFGAAWNRSVWQLFLSPCPLPLGHHRRRTDCLSGLYIRARSRLRRGAYRPAFPATISQAWMVCRHCFDDRDADVLCPIDGCALFRCEGRRPNYEMVRSSSDRNIRPGNRSRNCGRWSCGRDSDSQVALRRQAGVN